MSYMVVEIQNGVTKRKRMMPQAMPRTFPNADIHTVQGTGRLAELECERDGAWRAVWVLLGNAISAENTNKLRLAIAGWEGCDKKVEVVREGLGLPRLEIRTALHRLRA